MTRSSQGILITFEGTEGAGKSTLIQKLLIELRQRFKARPGIHPPSVTVTREPGGSAVAERIRSVLLEEKMDRWCELFLYEAARAEHLARTLRPALESGGLILCDRFTDSSLAYQAQARGLPWKQVVELNRMATQGISPALTVFVDIDPALGLSRARERNRFEKEGLRFQTEVRKGFLRAMRSDPKRWFWLKAKPGRTPEENAALVADEIFSRFGRRLVRRNR